MTATQFTALPHKTRKSCRGGASDVNGKKPKPYISDGSSIPRRIALTMLQWVMVLTSCTPTLPRYPALCRGWPYFHS